MSAAFDLPNKDILLPKMAKLGIPQNIIRIYKECLSNKKALVQCKLSASKDFQHAGCVCVQGSPSGPYFFTLLVDRISKYLPDVNMVAYADDIYFIF